MTRQFQRNRTKMIKAMKKELRRLIICPPVNFIGEVTVNGPNGENYKFPNVYCNRVTFYGDRLSQLRADYDFSAALIVCHAVILKE